MTSLARFLPVSLVGSLLISLSALAQNPPPAPPPGAPPVAPTQAQAAQPPAQAALPPPMQGDIVPPPEPGAPPPRPVAAEPPPAPDQQQQQQGSVPLTQGTYGASTYLRIGGQVVRFQVNNGLSPEQRQKFQQLMTQACFVDERAPASATAPCGMPIVWPKDQAGDGLAIYCDGQRDDCLAGGDAPRLRIAPTEPSRPPIAGNVSAYAIQARGAAKKSSRPRVYQADESRAPASESPGAQ